MSERKPFEIARETVKQLTARKLAPTPANYQKIYSEISELYKGGANGSIIGRNVFQRPRAEALKMLENIIGIYQGK